MEMRGVGEGSGPAGSKTPIFVQRRRNLVKTRIPVSNVSKVVSPSKANELETTIPPFPPSGSSEEKKKKFSRQSLLLFKFSFIC